MTRPDSHKNKKSQNPYKPKRDFKAYLKFIGIALILIFLIDFVIFKGERPYIKKMKAQYYAEKAAQEAQEQEAIEALLPPEVVYPEDGGEYFEAPDDETPVEKNVPEDTLDQRSSLPMEEEWEVLEKAPEVTMAEPAYEKPKFMGEKAKIAIVIDDVGMNMPQSRAALALPSAVTLAFLPYAQNVRALAKQARGEGHEMIIHTPMEAMNSSVSLGPMALRSDMDYAAFEKEFREITDSFEGYVGVNNHMGSKLTQDPEAMGYLMDELKKRGLYFFDSKTISTSIAADMAQAYDIPFAARDVFLDHVETPEFTAEALQKLERIAREQGSAIAIGHPKEITMQALRKWIPTLEAKGFELVSLSTLLEQPNHLAKATQPAQQQHFNNIAPAAGESEATSGQEPVQRRPRRLE